MTMLASLQHERQRTDEALATTTATLELLEPIVKLDTASHSAQSRWAEVMLVRAMILEANGDHDAARASLREGAAALEPLVGSTNDPTMLLPWAKLLIRLGRSDEVLPVLQKLQHMGVRDREIEQLTERADAASSASPHTDQTDESSHVEEASS